VQQRLVKCNKPHDKKATVPYKVDSDSDSENAEDQYPGGDTAANVKHVSPLFSSDSESEADLPDGRKENRVPDGGDTGQKPAANANTCEEHRKEAANVLLDLLHETAPNEPTKEVAIAKQPSKEPLVHDTDLIKTGPMDDSTHKEASKEVVQDTVSEIPPSKGPKKANESQKIKRKPLPVGRNGKHWFQYLMLEEKQYLLQ
jgi:hypothetical protein